MKMVKSLLLGSAASLAAVTAGQAADLPVKAKPVEYVKVCSLYGAGFYYMPGTDLCLKIGGWVRAEATYSTNQTGSLGWGPFNANLQQRSTQNIMFRARGYITADAREQTAYGTARGYIAVGVSTNDVGLAAGESANNSFSANRAFVQFAGFTAGIATSFFDFYSAPAALYRAGFLPNEDTGDTGWWVWAYTAQLGNGVSATISAEARRVNQIIDQTAPGAVFATGGIIAGAGGAGLGYGGQIAPDVVGNIRVDQAWGSAQVMGAWHEVNPLYFGSANNPALGGPSQKSGWVVGAGLRLNTPFIAQGDYFQGEANYTQGALRYLNHGANTNYEILNGNNETFGVQSDCVFGGNLADGNATNCQLTSAWSFNASFEHYWTPQLHQSLAGAYMAVKYGNTANAILCSAGGDGAGTGINAVANAGCNMNWNVWGIGSRLQYDVTKTFYVGVEALYTQLHGATTSNGRIGNFALVTPAAMFTQQNQNAWAFTARMHKDFLP